MEGSSSKGKSRVWNRWAPQVVPIIAAVVSVIGALISWNSAEYSWIQAEIQRQINLPNIDVIETFEPIQDNKLTSSIIIKNTGGPRKDFHVDAISFLQLIPRFWVPGGSLEVRIDGYYFPPTFTGRSKGLLARLGNLSNWDKASNLMKEFAYVKDSSLGVIPGGLITYLQITYRDALGDKHVEHCKVGIGPDMQPISPQQWESLFDTSKQTSIEINKLNPEELIRAFEEIMKDRGIPTHFQWTK